MSKLIDRESAIIALRNWKHKKGDLSKDGQAVYDLLLKKIRELPVLYDTDKGEMPEKKIERTDCFAWRKYHICAALSVMDCTNCKFYKPAGTECHSCPDYRTIHCKKCR